jgi:cytochrome c oxidase cbb3-type subunit 3
MNWRIWAGAALAAGVFLAGYDSHSGMPSAEPGPRDTASTHELGRSVYNFRCYFCHGYSGDARTLAATYLQPPPRDFRSASIDELGIDRIALAVRDGRPGTAMKAYRGLIPEHELQAVAAFVANEFVRDKATNTAYHTEGNGWPDHRRFEAAYPFARGELPLDRPPHELDARQRDGRKLYLSACVSCHDRGRVVDEGPAWSARPVSFPRMGFTPGQPNLPPVDAVSSASVYAKHELAPVIADLNPLQKRGEVLFQANCAFCHGADGTGKNWIGQFMEPKARDLSAYSASTMPPQRLAATIRDGLDGTSMPGWKHVMSPPEIEAVSAYVSRAFFRHRP